jgi:hypothetical protein
MPNRKGRAPKPRAAKRAEADPPPIEGNEPYTPESGERDSALPLGFQSTNDPGITVTDQPAVLQRGLSGDDQDVAWDRDDPLVRKPGIEADRLGSGYDPRQLGDETGDASSPRPDENVADEIGGEVGVSYEYEEELHTVDKVAHRDRDRWELNPASSEDFVDRTVDADHDRTGEDDLSPPA